MKSCLHNSVAGPFPLIFASWYQTGFVFVCAAQSAFFPWCASASWPMSNFIQCDSRFLPAGRCHLTVSLHSTRPHLLQALTLCVDSPAIWLLSTGPVQMGGANTERSQGDAFVAFSLNPRTLLLSDFITNLSPWKALTSHGSLFTVTSDPH